MRVRSRHAVVVNRCVLVCVADGTASPNCSWRNHDQDTASTCQTKRASVREISHKCLWRAATCTGSGRLPAHLRSSAHIPDELTQPQQYCASPGATTRWQSALKALNKLKGEEGCDHYVRHTWNASFGSSNRSSGQARAAASGPRACCCVAAPAGWQAGMAGACGCASASFPMERYSCCRSTAWIHCWLPQHHWTGCGGTQPMLPRSGPHMSCT